jgi:sugar lactone lactonase YvrE
MNRLTNFAIYRRARVLGDYWDAVHHRTPAPALTPEEVELGALIQRLHSVMDVDQSATGSRDPMLTHLLAKHQEMNRMSTTTLSFPARPGPTSGTRSRPSILPEPTRSRPRYRIAAVLVAAAVVLLAVGLALGPLGWRSDPSRRTAVPAAVVPAATPPAEPVAFLWQTSGDPADPMENATNLAIAPDGAIWVPDGRNARFQIFSPDGELLEVWGGEGTGEGQFDFLPTDGFGGYGRGAIAFAPDGSFYVADTGNNRIQKFGPDREFLLSWGGEGLGDGQFLGASDLAVDAQGRVYVVDANKAYAPGGASADTVQVFDAAGKFLYSWGASDAVSGALKSPMGITVDRDGTILIADYDLNRIERFTPEGDYLGGWGETGTREGLLFGPIDVAVDDQGNVYEVDYTASRFQVFDGDGRFLIAWGGRGTDDGEFTGPVAVAVDGAGNVYVTDDAGRLQKFHITLPPEPAASPAAGTPET